MKRILIVILCLMSLLACFLWIPKAQTNFDMTLYLPNHSQTRQGLTLLEDEFGVATSIQVMIDDITIDDMMTYKQDILHINHVIQVIWLDDYVDLTTVPLEFVPHDVKSLFVSNDSFLMTVVFNQDAYHTELEESIQSIKHILQDETYYMRGDALNHIESRQIANDEVIKIMVIVIPIILLILILSSHAWIEPVLILITLGLAVLFNLATNGLVEHISFITKTMALVLQLALSIDYALFMIHRYYEERKSNDKYLASKLARKHSFKSITISALTTIAGFTALFFMRYRIGLDIGLILSKGILFSYLSTMIILPILLIWFDPLIGKTKHKMLVFSFKNIFKWQYKAKYILMPLLVFLIGFGIYGTSKVDYLYGSSSLDSTSKLAEDQTQMTTLFGRYQPLVILFPNESIEQEIQLFQALSSHPKVISIDALINHADPSIPREFLPDELKNTYIGSTHSRMLLLLDIEKESEESYLLIEELYEMASDAYTSFYMIGEFSALNDIKTSVIEQDLWITLFMMIAVGLIIGILFKSLNIPIILVGLIMSAVWINMAILYVTGTQVIYIGYLVVMSIQLGATIDYAVLLTNRYMDYRIDMNKKDAMSEAFHRSGLTIFISGSILMIAGFAEGLFSHIDAIRNIGLLLGKGALISFLITFMFLPTLLVILDPLIYRKKRHTSS